MDGAQKNTNRKVNIEEAAYDGGEEMDEEAERRLRQSLSAIDRQYEAQPSVPKRIHIVGTGSIGKLVAHALRGLSDPPPVTLIFHRARLLSAWEKSKKVITVEDDGAETSHSGYDAELMIWERRQHGVNVDAKDDASDAYNIAEKTGLRPHEAAQVIAQQQRQEQNGSMRQQVPLGIDADQNAEDEEPIHNLIVTTKGIRTIPALSAIKHRLSASSTICFLQNGMGIIDDVNTKIFPDESTRPSYIQGVVSHGANVPPERAESDPFFVVHAGHGTISLGLPPSSAPPQEDSKSDPAVSSSPVPFSCPPTTRYLLRTLTRAPSLCAVAVTPMELFLFQLEKLAVNSVLNPLTVLIDARNGAVLFNFALTRTMRLLLAEISLVIRSLPELADIPNIEQRFSASRLETLIVGIAHKTSQNVSSMLADVRSGRQTEIEYINGYIVRRGEEIGIQCVVNYAIMQTVIGKCTMIQRELADEVPIGGLNKE